MKHEIGGFLELEASCGSEYHENMVAVNSGRNALLYLMKAKKISKVYIPYFLCHSVSDCCVKNGFDVELYHVNSSFMPIFDSVRSDSEYLYIVNYYGQISNATIKSLQEKYRNIIVDNTQAFFQPPVENVDTIYVCRKTFGLPDGAYISTSARLNEPIDTDVSYDRMRHLLGRFEKSANEFYSDFKKNDECFLSEPLKYMSKLTHKLLCDIDYDTAARKRNENFALLYDAFKDINKLDVATVNAPFAYPLMINDAAEIKRKLIEYKIYIPTLWPDVLNNVAADTPEYNFVYNLMPLPCDQRYGADEMQYMIKKIKEIIYA